MGGFQKLQLDKLIMMLFVIRHYCMHVVVCFFLSSLGRHWNKMKVLVAMLSLIYVVKLQSKYLFSYRLKPNGLIKI